MRRVLNRTTGRVRWAVISLVAVLTVAGCGSPGASTPPSGEAPSDSAQSSSAQSSSAQSSNGQPSGASTADLAKAKRQAGIRGCPASDPDVAARPGGLPDVTLDCLGGGRSVRLAGLRGTPTVINIWAQWCRPCRQEAPHLAALSAKADGKIAFLGIDYDDPDPAAAIEYAGLAGWSYPQLQDPQRTIRTSLKILGPPQTLFVDADGRIAYRHTGPFTSDAQLRRAIHDHLGVSL